MDNSNVSVVFEAHIAQAGPSIDMHAEVMEAQ
jgi:hypothetical protein